VQVHGLPLQNMTIVNAIKIGKFIGTVLNVENGEILGIISNHHLRIKVAIDITRFLVFYYHVKVVLLSGPNFYMNV